MTHWREWREAPAADYAVVGDPVSHSWSPKMHQAAYAALALDLKYEAVRIQEADFVTAMEHLAGLGYQGVNCTVPLKEAAATWCEEIDELSSVMGSINTVAFLDRRGTNTDAPAFLNTLRDLGVGADVSTLVLGGGGTARSLLRVLYQENRRVAAWNRTPAKLTMIREELALEFEIQEQIDVAEFGLIVNATSAGLLGSDIPVDWTRAQSGAVAYDVMYGQPSAFLDSAATHSLRTVDGLPLLVEQGALSFEWWLGKEAPRADMLKAVR